MISEEVSLPCQLWPARVRKNRGHAAGGRFYTRQPVADQWEINKHMLDILRTRYT